MNMPTPALDFSDSRIDAALMDRYLASECTPSEMAALEQFLAEHPAHARFVSDLYAVASVVPEPHSLDLDARWHAFRREVTGQPPRQALRARGGALHYAWRVGLLATLGVVAVTTGPGVLRRITERSAIPATIREHATTRGERAEITLADGSRVTLGVDSRLRYHQPFGGSDRVVTLEGEGYFSVVPDRARPFTVLAANSATQVLGTAFAVRAYPGDPVMQIAVAEGKVALRPRTAAPGSGTILARGDLGRIDRAGLTSVSRDVDVNQYTSWTRGRLVFRAVPLAEAVRTLERWYDVTVKLRTPEIAGALVTVTFDTESVDEALAILGEVLNLQVERHGQLVTLSPAP